MEISLDIQAAKLVLEVALVDVSVCIDGYLRLMCPAAELVLLFVVADTVRVNVDNETSPKQTYTMHVVNIYINDYCKYIYIYILYHEPLESCPEQLSSTGARRPQHYILATRCCSNSTGRHQHHSMPFRALST